MRALILPIKPKYVADILNGHKTIEIRKVFPKCDFPITVYIYCTKDNNYLLDQESDNKWFCWDKKAHHYPFKFKKIKETFNGKVVAKFTLKKIERIELMQINDYSHDTYETRTNSLSNDELCRRACIDFLVLDKYLNNKGGYAWFIDDLEIFDDPKDLSEFKKVPYENCNKRDKNGLVYCDRCPYGFREGYFCECRYDKPIEPPQSYCFCEELE